MSLLSDEQAQEIFKSEHCNISKDLAGILYRAIEAAVIEAQGKQKPVAWMHWYKYYDGTDVVKVAIGHAPTFNDQSPFRSEPLYAAPVVQQPALERYNKIMEGYSEKDPIERLRFFCSLSMSWQDWLDVERFFDDLTAPVVQPGMVKDAERYRWLRDESQVSDWDKLNEAPYPNWDDIIDAMIAAAEGKK